MSTNITPDADDFPDEILLKGSLQAPPFLFLVLLLTLFATALDQFAAPILFSTSPLWATATCLLLVWRRGGASPSLRKVLKLISSWKERLAAFLGAHLVVILVARLLTFTFQSEAGAITRGGTLLAAAKLLVLAPTFLLLPLSVWKRIFQAYRSEFVAALVVLLTFFPRRMLGAFWPIYGQALGRFVFLLAKLVVPGLAYVKNLTPTLSGPDLDVTIVTECSGINGLELFDILFALVVVCDWNRLRKGRTLLAYFAGLLAVLLGNALRITTLVVLGNHGFTEIVSRFHISAGWIFFSLIFLTYLFLTYGWMLAKPESHSNAQHPGQGVH